jgi:raffinose/stachyose/melibiose transport system substrate-binding protein
MNRRFYRGDRVIVAIALLALLTFAVGSAQARPAGKSAPLTITMYAGDAQRPGLSVLIPMFEKANPDVNVDVRYLLTAAITNQIEPTQLAAGNAPDILVVWPGCGTPVSVCKLAPAGYLANMPSKPWARRATSIAISASKYGGGLYVYSPAVTFEGLWTNDAMFKTLGLKVPQTFPQVLDVCRKARARGAVPRLLASFNSMVVQQLVGAFALTTVYAKDPGWLQKRKAGQVTFAGTPGWHAALQKLVDLTKAGCFQVGAAATTSPNAETLFGQGQALTYANMTSKKGKIDELKPSFGFSQHPFPITAKPNGSTVMLIVGSGWGVNAHSSPANRAAAQRLLDYLAQPKQSATFARVSGGLSQQQFKEGRLPAYLSSYQRLFKAKKYGVNPAQTFWNASAGDALTTYGTSVLLGQMSIDDALKRIDAAWKLGPD